MGPKDPGQGPEPPKTLLQGPTGPAQAGIQLDGDPFKGLHVEARDQVQFTLRQVITLQAAKPFQRGDRLGPETVVRNKSAQQFLDGILRHELPSSP